jgi:hypothetical protein
MSDSTETAKPSLRYVVAGVCRFDFVTAATPEQERDIPLMIAKAVADAVEGYTTRNTQATSVEFVSVTEI